MLRRTKYAIIPAALLPITLFSVDTCRFAPYYALFEQGSVLYPCGRAAVYGLVGIIVSALILFLNRAVCPGFRASGARRTRREILAKTLNLGVGLFLIGVQGGLLYGTARLRPEGHRGNVPGDSEAGRSPGPRNVLLITVDSLRRDHLAPYGYDATHTPFIDGLAEEGVLFERACTAATFTYGSLASVLTSRWPFQHGIRGQGWGVQPGLYTILEELDGHGFATGYSCALNLRKFLRTDGYIPRYSLTHLLLKIHKTFRSVPGFYDWLGEDGTLYQTVSAVDWLQRNHDRKFFFWIHYYSDPHIPYHAPAPFRRVPELQSDFPCDVESIGALSRAEEDIPDSLLTFIRDRYDEEIEYVDAQIGVLLQQMERLGVRRNTMIILSADHGEGLGEHHYFEHGKRIFEEQLRVPLILSSRGLYPPGTSVDCPVSTIDIAPTVLSALGVTPSDSLRMEGKDLSPLIAGADCDDMRPLYFESAQAHETGAKRVGVRWAHDKVVYECGAERAVLFDLSEDASERSPDSTTLDGLPDALVRFLSGEGVADMAALCPAEHAEPPISEDLERKLKSLGYLQ